MKANPPIPGHALLFEGKTRPPWSTWWNDDDTVYLALLCQGKTRPPWSTWWDDDQDTVYLGGCECGMKPDGFPKASISATQRWHRDHKTQIRSQHP